MSWRSLCEHQTISVISNALSKMSTQYRQTQRNGSQNVKSIIESQMLLLWSAEARDRAICYCFQFVGRDHTSAPARSKKTAPTLIHLRLTFSHPLCIRAKPMLSTNTRKKISQFLRNAIHQCDIKVH